MGASHASINKGCDGTYDWVASNCSPPFTENLMKKYRTGGFCAIPPGDAKAEEDKATLPLSVQNWLESHSPETLQYGQGDSQTCIYTSFANALHYLGLHDRAAQMIASKQGGFPEVADGREQHTTEGASHLSEP